MRGLSLAYLGPWEDAIQYAERGTTLSPVSKDAVGGAYPAAATLVGSSGASVAAEDCERLVWGTAHGVS